MRSQLRKLRLGRDQASGQGNQPTSTILTALCQIRKPKNASNTGDTISSQVDATNLLLSESNGNTPVSDNARLWRSAMKRYISRLSPEDQQLVQDPDLARPLNKHMLENIISPLRESLEEEISYRILHSLEVVINHVRSFAIVVDVAIQAHPNPASLIWGSLRLFLEASSKTAQLAEETCIMLKTIGARLSLFEQWLRLFPSATYSDLSQSIEDIYFEYISFLVDGIRYMRRTGIHNLLRTVLWPPLTQKFNKSNGKIYDLTETLILQVHTAGFQASASRDAEMQALLETRYNLKTTPSLKFIQDISRNEKFFGRTEILKDLHQRLDDSGGRQMSVAIYGPPGVGKSQIAIEYIYRYYDYYPVIIWLDGNDHLVLETQFTQLARRIGPVPVNGSHRAEVGSWLASLDCRWLIIFDNADNVNEIRSYWPASVRGSVIVTSRDPTAREEGLANFGIRIDPFNSLEGVNFVLSLLDINPPIDEGIRRAALELSQTFDGLPLGLKIAVSTMAHRNYTPEQFTKTLMGHIEEIEEQGIISRGNSQSLATLFDMVLSSLEPAAADLLDTIAFLDPKNIAIELFESNEGGQLGIPNFRSIARHLWKQSLLKFDDPKTSVNIHGYIHSFIYRRLLSTPDRYDQALRSALDYLSRCVPGLVLSPNRNSDLWPKREKFLPHVRSLEKCAKNQMPKDCVVKLTKLLTSYGYYFYEIGVYHLGHEVLDTTRDLIERSKLTDTLLLSQLEFTKGKLYNEGNEPEKAEPHWREALRIFSLNPENSREDRLNLGPEYLCMVYSGLGISLTAQDKFEEGEELHRQAVANVSKLSGQTPTHLGILHTNLGSCLLWQGRLTEAEEVLHTALLKHDRVLGCTMYSLANVYLAQGRTAESFAMHKEVLEQFSKALGHTHLCTADSCVKIGILLAHPENEERDIDQAQRFIRKAIDIFVHWAERGQEILMRPYLARAQWNLAEVLENDANSCKKEIFELKQKARAGYQEITGNILPDATKAASDALDALVFYWSR